MPLDDFDEHAWDKVMDTNVKGVFFLTQKLLPNLRAAGTPPRHPALPGADRPGPASEPLTA
jgi:NAD(P)-dependent dehydrogenase (short-subunit alcohol dehydrogenase family)